MTFLSPQKFPFPCREKFGKYMPPEPCERAVEEMKDRFSRTDGIHKFS